MFNARMKSDVLGVAVVLSADGSINGGTLGGTLLCPFEFCLLKQVVISVMCSYYRHHSSISQSPLKSSGILYTLALSPFSLF